MNNEDKIFELMTKMYSEFSEFKEDMTEFKKDMTEFKKDMTKFKEDITETVDSIHKTVIKIENEHGEKLSALFDGWKQNTDRLDRIEKEMLSPNEAILRKIK